MGQNPSSETNSHLGMQKNSMPFMETEVLLLCLQEPPTCLYHEPD
jgi:hypothetical protein